MMKILVIYSGEYGKRHLENIRQHGPGTWEIASWESPAFLPLVIDYPEDYLPETLPPADLILSFAEHKGVAELLPDIAQMTGAQAVLVAVDKEAWLPKGLARQLIGWLAEINVACVTPTPLCSLTEQDYGLAFRHRMPYESTLISEFARTFGQPDLQIAVDPQTRTIAGATVNRDAVCGCARFVAEELVGVSVDEAEEKAGLLHHHYPCLASMMKNPDFNGDTLMHVSGQVLKDNVGRQVKPFKQTNYIVPGKRSE
jgi:hypothetical protein